jgi:hypothetical protein
MNHYDYSYEDDNDIHYQYTLIYCDLMSGHRGTRLGYRKMSPIMFSVLKWQPWLGEGMIFNEKHRNHNLYSTQYKEMK